MSGFWAVPRVTGWSGLSALLPECVDRVPVEQLVQILVVDDLDLLDFMRGTEAVEEMQEGHPALDGREVRDRAEIHDLLHAVAASMAKPVWRVAIMS